ncbi:Hamartin protein-domain-containing protein [Neohortaea acidophila]|uniref:Hamartin protein-domain-containing protein n=1 Tax=Neohortaea acidophila TaxID=245834 RepID=A0A6A6PT81_9PEZI|nr:Hamartin protein-domain-containing protein [Neohortaea acidophila]KAF2483192.1 Hamartin protein-domain-containing protein [Neohortaea acidophila]
MDTRALREITKVLQTDFNAKKSLLSLPAETRRMLQSFIDEFDDKSETDDAQPANLYLKGFWEKYVRDTPQKFGMFMGVVRELRPAIAHSEVQRWTNTLAFPILNSTGHAKTAVEDAAEFLIGFMLYDEEQEDITSQAQRSGEICKRLWDIYSDRTSILATSDPLEASDNAQVAQQVEDVLIAFGRKKPKDLFNLLDTYIITSDTRLRSLSLLTSFLRHETPHLYLVLDTPLVGSLLTCLMNDTYTAVLSIALTSLIMLLPHIPGSLGPHLPRCFLVYTRLLCWEKFSDFSTEEQKSLVTDDRVSPEDEDEDSDGVVRSVGMDASWQRLRSPEGTMEASTPEIMTYFTSLYGLYPLNLMSYVRKPRRYLRNIEFPGAESFDLDRTVIRSRTEQFREVHLLHPNFYNTTAEEELVDPKWPKMDPADVVGECEALCMHSRASAKNSAPSSITKLPGALQMRHETMRLNGQLSPTASQTSLRSSASWRDTQSTTASVKGKTDSPIVRPRSMLGDEETLHEQHPLDAVKEKPTEPPQTNIEFLQRELSTIRNELNFERWHKAQYSQHIGQIMRRNIKGATVEAETLNLINANRALKKQLEQLRKAREATIKDSALTRRQANSLEANMTERFNSLKIEQETWQADADELRRLRAEVRQYRTLLVTSENRETNTGHRLLLAQRDLEELQAVREKLERALSRIHEFESREFEFEIALRERDLLRKETKGASNATSPATSARSARRSSEPGLRGFTGAPTRTAASADTHLPPPSPTRRHDGAATPKHRLEAEGSRRGSTQSNKSRSKASGRWDLEASYSSSFKGAMASGLSSSMFDK